MLFSTTFSRYHGNRPLGACFACFVWNQNLEYQIHMNICSQLSASKLVVPSLSQKSAMGLDGLQICLYEHDIAGWNAVTTSLNPRPPISTDIQSRLNYRQQRIAGIMTQKTKCMFQDSNHQKLLFMEQLWIYGRVVRSGYWNREPVVSRRPWELSSHAPLMVCIFFPMTCAATDVIHFSSNTP